MQCTSASNSLGLFGDKSRELTGTRGHGENKKDAVDRCCE
jgi:hypothetical protein